MEICLNGCENNEKIKITIKEVLGFPDRTSCEGGYDLLCELIMDISCHHIEFHHLYSATGALYRFEKNLRACYSSLEGEAEYKLLLEDDFSFKVAMTTGGHGIVSGYFRERPDKDNIFQFEMETDQTCLYPVIQAINSLKESYGDMEGIR